MQKLALRRGSNSMHLEEDSHKPLIFMFTPLLERDPADFSQKTWSENSMQDRIMTLSQYAFPQVESLYLQKENTVGQMNSPYCTCGILYFARSRGSWTSFWKRVICLARAALSAQQYMGELHVLLIEY